MKVTVTSLELKGPLKFFALSYRALQIVKQLKSSTCKEYRSQGFWTKHYTMSLWNSEEELKEFARSGAHLDAMKQSKAIAKEIRTYTYDSDTLPSWKMAKKILKKARVIKFDS